MEWQSISWVTCSSRTPATSAFGRCHLLESSLPLLALVIRGPAVTVVRRPAASLTIRQQSVLTLKAVYLSRTPPATGSGDLHRFNWQVIANMQLINLNRPSRRQVA